MQNGLKNISCGLNRERFNPKSDTNFLASCKADISTSTFGLT